MKKQLIFTESSLFGRTREISVLDNAYETSSSGAQVVLLHGASGTGKSSVVKEYIKDKNLVGSGKFEEQMGQPYATLVSASSQLVDQGLKSESREMIKKDFEAMVSSEGIAIILSLIPRLDALLHKSGHANTSSNGRSQPPMKHELKYTFRALFRSICNHVGPLVLFLDDWQNADQSSLDLLKAIATDSSLKNFVLIGCYRHDETTALPSHIVNWIPDSNVVEVENLPLSVLNEWIAHILELNEKETKPLAEHVHRNTNGNAFYAIQLMQSFVSQDLLTYDLRTYKWTWDLSKIQSRSVLQANVVELVAARVCSLPPDAQTLLTLASCVWSTFHMDTLQSILVQAKESSEGCMYQRILSIQAKDVGPLLEVTVQQGLLDKVHDIYKFSHDRIQEAAYNLVSKGRERDLFHLWMGNVLYSMSTEKEEWVLFAAANQYNRCLKLVKDREKVATLNLSMGEKAISLSAFVPASSYLRAALQLLEMEPSPWVHHYSLMLKVCNALADTGHCLGNFEECDRVVQLVLSNARCFEDTRQVEYTRMFSLFTRGKHVQLDLACHNVLKQVGEPMPRQGRRFQIMREYSRMKRLLKDKTDQDLLERGEMTQENKILAIDALSIMHQSLLHRGRALEASAYAIKSMAMSVKYGICSESCMSFAFWGMQVVQRELDLKGGYRFGKLAIAVAERFQCNVKSIKALVYNFLIHWKEPLTNSLDPLLDGYKYAMVRGEPTKAFQSISAYQMAYFYAGLPLEPIVTDMIAYSDVMLEYGQHFSRRAVLPFLQCMLNLMGRSTDPLTLSGSVMEQSEFEDPKMNPSKDGVRFVLSCRMQLAYYFGNFELAWQLSRDLQKYLKKSFSVHYTLCVQTFFFGLIDVALARSTGRKKYVNAGRRHLDEMESKWVRRGAINCVHKLLLLKAEFSSIGKKKDPEIVRRVFDDAISSAKRAGFVQDEALANERAGDYFFDAGDEYWASSYLSRALEAYSEWGAMAKTKQLKERYGRLLLGESDDKGKINMMALRAKTHFTDEETEQHKKIVSSLDGCLNNEET